MVFSAVMLGISTLSAQLKSYSFEEIEKSEKENPKPIVVFVHTDWCKYCAMMQNTTFKNKEVQSVLNKDFYYISFDAESREPILFNEHLFKFIPKGPNSGIHELAQALADEDAPGYPFLVVLKPDFSVLYRKSGYVKKDDFLMLLKEIRKMN